MDDYEENDDCDFDEDMDGLDRDEFDDEDRFDDYEQDDAFDDLDDAREDVEENFGMTPEEAGYADGQFDSADGSTNYASYGASINLDELSEEARDRYDNAYHAGLEENR